MYNVGINTLASRHLLSTKLYHAPREERKKGNSISEYLRIFSLKQEETGVSTIAMTQYQRDNKSRGSFSPGNEKGVETILKRPVKRSFNLQDGRRPVPRLVLRGQKRNTSGPPLSPLEMNRKDGGARMKNPAKNKRYLVSVFSFSAAPGFILRLSLRQRP